MHSIYEGLATIFIHYSWRPCANTNDNSVHSQGSKFAIVFCLIANDLSYYVFSKNVNG